MLSAPADPLVHIICFGASKLEYSTATHYKCNQIYGLIFGRDVLFAPDS